MNVIIQLMLLYLNLKQGHTLKTHKMKKAFAFNFSFFSVLEFIIDIKPVISKFPIYFFPKHVSRIDFACLAQESL